MKKTSLYEEHLKSKAKMMGFAGYEMPLQYEGIQREHHRVRSHVGLFDVSHMGELRVRGHGAVASLQWMTSNNVERLAQNKAQYALLTNFQGGIVDDVLVYCIEKNTDYLVCVNAINKEKDLQWMLQNQKQDTHITDESHQWSQIAIQGPKALILAERVFGSSIAQLEPFYLFHWQDSYIARTGYTGEEGVEVFIPHHLAVSLWNRMFRKGE